LKIARLYKITRVLAALFAMLASIAGLAQPADYPHKPIRLIVPNAGASDLIARALGAELNELWGVPVIVETPKWAEVVRHNNVRIE
jgi:tripartite-type tricarboxylate transporter receptor subunit TctC